jgi:hypothetical protein
MSRIIEAILAPRSTVTSVSLVKEDAHYILFLDLQVDDQVESMVSGPGNSLVQERELSLLVRFPSTDIPSPVTNGETDMV